MNKRWLKNAKPFNSAVARINVDLGLSFQSEVFDLYEIFESTVDRLVNNMDKLKIYKDEMNGLLAKAKIDVPVLPKINSKDVMSSMLGVKEPKKRSINNPDQSVTKGTGVHSRWKSINEVEKEESDKRRTCSICGRKDGHNSRTCTREPLQPSKKVKRTVEQTRTGLRTSKRKNEHFIIF